MEVPIKERIISTMFERWCSQIDHDPEQREAMKEAIAVSYTHLTLPTIA